MPSSGQDMVIALQDSEQLWLPAKTCMISSLLKFQHTQGFHMTPALAEELLLVDGAGRQKIPLSFASVTAERLPIPFIQASNVPWGEGGEAERRNMVVISWRMGSCRKGSKG